MLHMKVSGHVLSVRVWDKLGNVENVIKIQGEMYAINELEQ